MRRMVIGWLWAVLLAGAVGAGAASQGPADAEVRQAAARALPFLEREGVAWIKERACMSCHTFTFTLWTHHEARGRGLPVDARKLAEWDAWARKESLGRRAWFTLTEPALAALAEDGVPAAVRDRLLPLKDISFVTGAELVAALDGALSPEDAARYREAVLRRAAQPRSAKNDGGGLDTLAQLLLSGAPGSDWQPALTELLARWQEPDGSWKTAGQMPSQNRPVPEGHQVATAWVTLALDSLVPTDAAAQRLRDAGLARLEKAEPGRSTEWLAVRLLLARGSGTPEQVAAAEALRQRQNPDGGWPWLPGGRSDAYATGQALYALARAGIGGKSVQRARAYLLRTQEPDGAWSVPPEGISRTTSGPRLEKLRPIYRYWGTAWATLGLLRTLPAKTDRLTSRRQPL